MWIVQEEMVVEFGQELSFGFWRDVERSDMRSIDLERKEKKVREKANERFKKRLSRRQ